MPVHKSEGLEGNILIALQFREDGLPEEMSDDPVLNMPLSVTDQYPSGEERRLFYVPMTRGKRKNLFHYRCGLYVQIFQELE